MKRSLRNTLRLLRPRQWIKNLAIFGAITFGGELFDVPILLKVTYGFLIFCAVSSGIYIINDIFDREKDKLHPFKKFRPLAHGDISLRVAVVLAILLIGSATVASYFINPAFFLITMIYLILQFSYSAFLKNVTVIDILALAGGYILRVYAGEFASSYHISVWLLLTTISLSLFLAVGKRRSELTLVSTYSSAQIAAIRKTLSHYSERLLDVYASIFATSTFITYSLFTFLENARTLSVTNDLLLPDFLPDYLKRKWLMLTIFPVVYGLMRYLQDIYEKHEGESPERVIISDKPLLVNVIIWVLLVILIIYVVGV
ncbi:MAG: decaprenyl-phosphate phosphoribosyltransferase [bacterium]|nr:decaprenyl-phosphate phosphoribosyltransferase [bacterium]